MPIGKSAIKRVSNNGYSNVKTNAPDMENSTVIANPSPEVVEKLLPKSEEQPTSKTLTPKKPAAKTSATKKPVSAKPAAKKPAQEKKTAPKASGSYVNVGRDLPTHLL